MTVFFDGGAAAGADACAVTPRGRRLGRENMKRRARVSGRTLTITRMPDGHIKTADISQSPDYTVTSTTDGGGQVLTAVEVAAIFWGSFWSTTPAPNPSSDTYYQAFTGLVTGPYLTGCRQYRGVGPGTMLGKFINDSTDPVDGYSDGDVVTMLTNFLDNNSSVPAPASGHTRFYAVVTPPGINNGLSGDIGQHQSFTYKGQKGFYCWVDSVGGLADTGSSDGVVNIFAHELAEACTDPNGDSILVNGSGVSNDEIGDTCNNEFAIVQMNGVKCNVQCYWSKADNACIIPLGHFQFLINKNTFGEDEVKEAIATTGGVFSNAFWLALDDFSIDTFNSFNLAIPTPDGPFRHVSGVSIVPSPATPGGPIPAQPIPVYEDASNTSLIQRIRFSFDVVFASPLTTPFDGSEYELTATFTTNGDVTPGAGSQDTVNFQLIAGADPYFSNIDPTDNAAVSYLSQDLRVFSVIKGASALPNDTSAPSFDASQSAYDYIQSLLGYLNGSTAYTKPVPPGSADPLNGLTDQTGFETGDSSVTPTDGHGHQNFNFAVARVRLTSSTQGPSSDAVDVRVFFRLWIAPSFDTDFDPNTTYPSSPAYPGLPHSPLPSSASLPPDPSGRQIRTTPFFATGQAGASDYDDTVANNNIRKLEIPVTPGQDSVWGYYGCFLDVYDTNNNCSYPGTHHCIVAQIAYDGAPVLFDSGTPKNPGNTDKLAQRNLQITLSGNPGPASTHRIPQPFDTRASLPFLDPQGVVLNQPDEIMIDWGNVPTGAKAQIFWPEVEAADVIALADRLYGTHRLATVDPHTLGFAAVKDGVTYIPIPPSADANMTFAGLFTVDLPLGVKKGQEFNVVVRRITTQSFTQVVIEKPAPRRAAPGAALRTHDDSNTRKWRVIAGAFKVKIPVTTEAEMLHPEENTLAILKARLAAMSPTYRWRPVTERLIEYVAGRVKGSGGDPGAVPPSLQGFPGRGPRPHPGPHHHPGEREHERTGKICGIIFDHFGDFEGFLLETREGEYRYASREQEILDLVQRAWRERLRLTVWSELDAPHRPLKLVLRDPPACLEG
jgi:hypothetical protein